MEDKALAELVLAELCDVHGCHTVILYGSRARGDATPDSDWDVLGVRDHGETLRVVRELDGACLDAFIHPETALDTLDEGALRWGGGRILVDRDAFGARLLARIADFERAGPAPLTPADEALRRSWTRKMLARARRGDVEGDYRRAWLLTDLLESYFRLRTAWYRGPKESFAWLARHDPEGLVLFQRALAPSGPADALDALARYVLAAQRKD